MIASKSGAGGELPNTITGVLRHHNVRFDRVEYVPIERLVQPGRATRHRSDKKKVALQGSVAGFGIVVPVLVNASNQIIDGAGIVEAAKAAGYLEVPVLRIEHLSPGEERLLRIALNKLAENTQWDRIELAAEFSELIALDLELAYEVTGFDTIEIDNLIHEPVEDRDDDADDRVEPVGLPGTEVSRIGDIWELGNHRIACGSSLEEPVLTELLAGIVVRMVLTDHPFNVPISGHVSGLGKHKHREFALASGEMSETEFVKFLTDSIETMAAHCIEGALLYMYIDWRHVWEMMTAIRAVGLTLVNVAVWVKRSGGMGSFYRSQHELCVIAKKGNAAHQNNVQLGRFGRNRTNCWFYAGANSFGQGRDDLLAMHPTSKNVAMLADAIRDATNRGEVVFDGFLGSGSTLIAAERTGRRCFGVELDPLYVDLIVRRWETATGHKATLAGSDETIEQVERRRAVIKIMAASDGAAEPLIAPPPRRRAR